jgi:hypothetical protein
LYFYNLSWHGLQIRASDVMGPLRRSMYACIYLCVLCELLICLDLCK